MIEFKGGYWSTPEYQAQRLRELRPTWKDFLAVLMQKVVDAVRIR